MKHIIIAAAVLVATAATARAEYVDPDSTGFTFTDIKVVRTTPVKDQNRSGTCWSFSGCSFLEDEVLRKGGPEVDLSEMYVVRQCYRDKAERFIRRYGETNFAGGGAFADVIHTWRNYGMMPEEAYPGIQYGEEKHQHSELDAVLLAYVKAVASKPGKRLTTAWRKGLEGILDAYLGPVPETFTHNGKTYTPKSYARSLGLDMDDYVSVTSFTHHPYDTWFDLEIPDNWLHTRSYNVPLDRLQRIVDAAIDSDHTVAWAADVSEGGFQWYKGYALMPKKKEGADMEGTELSRWVHLSDKDREAAQFDIKGPVEEIEVTAEVRQDMFDRQETTDDHGMVIVGRAVDQLGNPYYKVKNSWDTNQIYDGYFYISVPYFLAKTVSVTVHKDLLDTK